MSDNKKDQSIAIFGGTFNPIHIGHLRLAEDVREEFNIDRIIFIPTNIPPHKELEGGVSAIDRLNMVRIAVRGNKNFDIDDIEIKRGGVSYTVDTVRYLYREYNFKDKPYFIIGSDQARIIDKWKGLDELSKKLKFIVLIRKNERDKIEEIKGIFAGKKIDSAFFAKREIDITSSEIRNRVKEGKSIRYLVVPEVYKYIFANNLYS